MRFFLHRFIVSIIFRGVVADAAFGQGQEADYLGESAVGPKVKEHPCTLILIVYLPPVTPVFKPTSTQSKTRPTLL